jgi:hypothetical protein
MMLRNALVHAAESAGDWETIVRLLLSVEHDTARAALHLLRGARMGDAPALAVVDRISAGAARRIETMPRIPMPPVFAHPVQMHAADVARSRHDHEDGDGDRDEASTDGAIRRIAAEPITGGGAPLPHLAEIQRAFGPAHDLSDVRTEIGGRAGRAATRIGAEAYAISHFVAFRETPSLALAAHEAAHVVQQRAGAQVARGVGRSGDEYERAADAVAERVARGESAADLLPAPAVRITGASTAAPAGVAVQRSETPLPALVEAELRAAIVVFEQMPDDQFGPLTPILKSVAIAYFRRLAQEGGAELAELVRKSVRVMTSGGYAWQFSKGALRGFFIDGMLGVFVLVRDIAALLARLGEWYGDVLHEMLSGEMAAEAAALFSEVRALGVGVRTSIEQLVAHLMTEAMAGKLDGDVGALLRLLLTKAQGAAGQIGTAVADRQLAFFKQPEEVLQKIGHVIGEITGNVAWEIVFAVLTSGGGAAAGPLKAAVKWLMSAVGKGAKLTLDLLIQLGRFIEDAWLGLKGLFAMMRESKLLAAIGGRLEKVFAKLRPLLGRLIEWLRGEEKLGRLGKAGDDAEHGAGALGRSKGKGSEAGAGKGAAHHTPGDEAALGESGANRPKESGAAKNTGQAPKSMGNGPPCVTRVNLVGDNYSSPLATITSPHRSGGSRPV